MHMGNIWSLIISKRVKSLIIDNYARRSFFWRTRQFLVLQPRTDFNFTYEGPWIVRGSELYDSYAHPSHSSEECMKQWVSAWYRCGRGDTWSQKKFTLLHYWIGVFELLCNLSIPIRNFCTHVLTAFEVFSCIHFIINFKGSKILQWFRFFLLYIILSSLKSRRWWWSHSVHLQFKVLLLIPRRHNVLN